MRSPSGSPGRSPLQIRYEKVFEQNSPTTPKNDSGDLGDPGFWVPGPKILQAISGARKGRDCAPWSNRIGGVAPAGGSAAKSLS